MTILSIYYKNKKGGFTNRLKQCYSSLGNEGHVVHYISAEKMDINHLNVYCHCLKCPFTKNENLFFWLYFILAASIYSLILVEKYKVDRIIVFSPIYGMICGIPALLHRIPIITFIRADNMLHSTNVIRNMLFYLIDMFGITLSSAVVTVNHSLLARYRKRYKIKQSKMKIAPNNIALQLSIEAETKRNILCSLGIGGDVFIISCAGAFNSGKNFTFPIRAVDRFKKYPVKLLLIGDEVERNGEKEKLRVLVERLDLSENVVFCGWQKDPRPLMACSDLFILPSRAEGSPNALLEALGCDVPCLGSRIEEIAEVLKYDDLMFSLENENELVLKIERMLSDGAYYDNIKRLSQECAGRYRFDWGKRVTQIVESL